MADTLISGSGDGYNVLYICGTDEYGTATETKALEENCTPKEICDKYHAIHKEVYDWFDISFDHFGRTSTPQQTEVCQAIFKKLLDNNWLSENTMHQLYCDVCRKFLADRLVDGTCPYPDCSYNSARGDQCEKCSKLLNPTELVDPKCKVCRNSPHIRDTNHLFLELPLLKDKLEKYKITVEGSWSENAIKATNGWLKEGLRQRCITRDLKWGVPVPHERFKDKRCITRDLKWGVPVPHERFKDKVFYVWFDAPIGYISITSCYTREWEKWWKNPKDVELYQFMGKDNVPFHTIMFPSTLLGTDENWTLLKTLSVTEYLKYENDKFSKSKGVGVFGNDAKETNIPVEVWRYYLLANRPEGKDTVFKWVDLQAQLKAELRNKLGNFINRVLCFIAKDPGYNSIVPDAPGADAHKESVKLGEKIGTQVDKYIKAMDKVELKDGLKAAMEISDDGNLYLQKAQFWNLYREDLPKCSIVMKTSVGVVYLLACLLEPFMPSFSVKVLKQLALPLHLSLSDEDVQKAKRPWELIPSGHRIGTPVPLFTGLNDEQVEFFREKYAEQDVGLASENFVERNLFDMSITGVTRFSMSGLMHRLGISRSLRVTRMSGRSGGRIRKMWSCISLWARIMYPFILDFNYSIYDFFGSGYNSIVPDAPGADAHKESVKLGEKIGTQVDKYIKAMDKVELKEGLKAAMEISDDGNLYLQKAQFWNLYREELPKCSIVMKTSVGVVYLLACLLEPFMPSFSVKVLKQLALPLHLSLSDEDVQKAKRPWELIPAGHRIGTLVPLFTGLNDEQVEFFREKYAGNQADRAARAEGE
nr:probable methionine--tRNA ligase [Tanacetum cinerariifolium]